MVGIRPLQHLGHSTSEDLDDSEPCRGDLGMVDASVAGYRILAGGWGHWAHRALAHLALGALGPGQMSLEEGRHDT